MPERETAIIVGAGPGLGAALGQAFADSGMQVALAARRRDGVAALAEDIGPAVRPYACDATDEAAVEALFDAVEHDLGPPDVAVFNAGAFQRTGILETTTEDFVNAWRVGCEAGFFVGREAARRMAPRGRGTILFTGATASLRGGAMFHCLAVPKFGLRALAQSMARELGPQGVHVAHVVIDGVILSARSAGMAKEGAEDSLLEPAAVAANYLALHRQPRSAWTHELDLRPWSERF